MRQLFLPAVFAAAVGLGLAIASSAPAQAPRGQPIRIPSLASQSINPNPYIAPGLTLRQYAYNTKVIGRALSAVPPYALGYNPYVPVVNYGPLYANPYASAYLSTPIYPYSSYASASPYSP